MNNDDIGRGRDQLYKLKINYIKTFFSLQVRGHQRVPSDSKEFHEVTKRDALQLLESELDKLLQTAEAEKTTELRSDMKRFSDLFGRFLQEEGPSIDWSKIKKLPAEAVRDYAELAPPNQAEVSSLHTIYDSLLKLITDDRQT